MSILHKDVLNRICKDVGVSSKPSTNRAVIPHIEQRQGNYSLDTVKLRFICNQQKFEEYCKCIKTAIHEKDRDNDLEDFSVRYICSNVYNQSFEAFYDNFQDTYRVFIEFSLPKLLHYTNLSKCFFQDLYNYVEDCIKPYAISPDTILWNRLDIATNYSFNSPEDLNSFEGFLRTHKLGNKDMESSKDYCFWKMTDRVVRFYKKYDEIKDKDKVNLNKFDKVGDYLDARAHNHSYLKFAKDNNIGRLEFEYKRDWIEQKFGSNKFYKIFPFVASYDWMSQFRKDFPFIEKGFFEVKDMERIEFVIAELKKYQKTRDYLEFLLLAKSHSLEYAEEKFKIIKGKNYSRFISRFFEITGFTIEQSLQDVNTCVNFPSEVAYYTPDCYEVPEEYSYMDFGKLEDKIRKNKMKKERIRMNKARKRYSSSYSFCEN